MKNNFLNDLCTFSVDNFNFDPSTGKNAIILSKKPKKLFSLDELNFPGNETISNLFFCESLSLLLKMKNLSTQENKKIVYSFLQIIYAFYSGNKEIITSLDILGYIIPYKNAENIEKCFCESDDYISFIVFNLILILYKQIPRSFLDNNNFYILETVLLYDYVFIRGCVKNVKIKYEVTKVIKISLNDYTASSEIDLNVSYLKNFFFESGKINKNSFLIPENKYEKGLNEFNNLIDSIYEIINNGLKYRNIIDNLKNINKLKRKRLNMEEGNEKTESPNENIEEPKEDNIKKIKKEFQETLKNMKKAMDEKEEKFNNQINLLIDEQKKMREENEKKIEELQNSNKDLQSSYKVLQNSNKDLQSSYKVLQNSNKDLQNSNKKLQNSNKDLQNSIKEQNNKIEAQALNIQTLNEIILKKETIIGEKDESLKDLKQDISNKNKDLKQNKMYLNESKIKIDNQSKKLIKNSQLINKLNEEVCDLKKLNNDNKNKINELCIRVNSLSNKIDLIGCRDFLRRIIIDFCFFYNVRQYNNFKDAARLINEEIKKNKINNTYLQEFTKKVNLTKFIEIVGNILDASDNLSHLYFKELTIKYRDQNIQRITNVENITKNIYKCKDAIYEFSKINFDSVFSFFINDFNYPNYLINNIPTEEKDFSNAIIKNLNNK